MTREQHLTYWLRSAEDDWEVVNSLLVAKKYVQCLFFAYFIQQVTTLKKWLQDQI